MQLIGGRYSDYLGEGTGVKAVLIKKRTFEMTARLPSRLYVHQHICDAGVALLDGRLYPMGNLVPFVHGNVSVHSDVQIDVIIQAHLAGVTFFHLENARNRAGDCEELI